jgi:hypothetical protein
VHWCWQEDAEEGWNNWQSTVPSRRCRSPANSTSSTKTRGNLTTNDGKIAVNWVLDGHDILMRARVGPRAHSEARATCAPLVSR